MMKIKKKIGQLTGEEYYDLRHIISNMEIEIEKPDILTENEKNYLCKIIDFYKDKVIYVIKRFERNREYNYFEFILDSIVPELDYDFVFSPIFRHLKSFEGMKEGHKYTLEELGI